MQQQATVYNLGIFARLNCKLKLISTTIFIYNMFFNCAFVKFSTFSNYSSSIKLVYKVHEQCVRTEN